MKMMKIGKSKKKKGLKRNRLQKQNLKRRKSLSPMNRLPTLVMH
jgi:hypothetical protein